MTTARMPRERARRGVHIGLILFAFALRYIAWWQAAIVAATALAFNRFALPRIGGAGLYRHDDRSRGYSAGILAYPLSVLLLILLFPQRLDIVAASWGILAVGDGMANVVGAWMGGPLVPWSDRKTVAGSVAMVVFGGAAGALLAWWCRPTVVPPAYAWFSIGAPVAAAIVAALVESLPIRLDDNLSVPAAAAGVLWVFSSMSQDLIAVAWAHARVVIPVAVAANIILAVAGYGARTVSVSGAIVGAVIGVVIVVTTGWQGWSLLLVTFAAASLASRVGLARKTRLGIAEERGGRRGAENAIANTGVAAAAGLMAVTTHASGSAIVGFVAALAAGGSDTIASEIGKAFGRRTWLVHTLAPVPPGTPGAMSVEGTLAGVAGAAVLATFAVAVGLIPLSGFVAVVAGATIGALVESVLAATLEHRAILNNDVLNFINTAAAAWAAVVIAGAA